MLACLITLGSYYIYDFPSSIGTGPEHTIQARFHSQGATYTQSMNLVLYTVYSWPNTVLALLGGILVDKVLGLRKALLIFCSLVFIGSGIFCVGVVFVSYPLVLLGRLCYGFGAESLSVSQSAFVARWFRGKRGFSLAFALSVVFSRVGSSMNFGLSPTIAEQAGVQVTTFVGFLICGFSLAACVGTVLLDRLGESRGLVPPVLVAVDRGNSPKVLPSGEGVETTSDPQTELEQLESEDVGEETEEGYRPRRATPSKCRAFCQQLRSMPTTLWVLSAITLFAYCAIFPFIGFAKNFFQVKFGEDPITAGDSISIYEGLAAGALPVAGLLVDLVGRNVLILITTHVWLCGIHLLFLIASLPSLFMMILMTPCYTFIVASLWTQVPLIVEESRTGFAYGLMTSVQNFGLAIFPLMTGAVLDAFTPAQLETAPPSSPTNLGATSSTPPLARLPTIEGYHYALLIVLTSAAIGLMLSITLFILDRRGLKVLAASPAARQAIRDALKDAQEPLTSDVGCCGETSSDA